MKYYTMVDMAKNIGIPESSARGYRDRFPSYITTTGQGRGKRYTDEALEALRIAATMSRKKIPTEDIETALEARFGIVIESQDSQQQTSVTSLQIVEQTITPEELTGLFKQAMKDALMPLQSELIETKIMLTAERIRQTQNEKALRQEIATLNASIKTIEAVLQANLEATLEVAAEMTLEDDVRSIEKRQQEREAAQQPYPLPSVDERLAEPATEPKKGFWARLFKK